MRRAFVAVGLLVALAAAGSPRTAPRGCWTYGVEIDGVQRTVLAHSARDARAGRWCR